MLHPLRLGRLTHTIAITAALGLLVAACAGAGASVRATDPWVRFTGPDVPAGGFVVLANDGDADDALVSATSPDFGSIELHETVDSGDGVMAMQKVTSIPVAAGGTTALEPGGFHMMLFDPTADVAIGQPVEITLTFEDGASITVQATVQAP
jgi:copper(I)-binding protein